MPTITLRNVTKRYGGEEKNASKLAQIVADSAQALFDDGRSSYMRKLHVTPEPSDRGSALDDISLTIRDGETLSIIGPSGCGKTTLLKVIAGLLKIDSGEILYDGVTMASVAPGNRGIGMVFQNYALYPHLSSLDNIGFFDVIHKQPEKIPERIHHIADVMGVDIRHLLARKPPTLSSGEQQRVAIARCLARDPQLFLFDEPLSNLDAKLRVETRVQIKRLLRHYQITSVYVTHDQYEATAIADRLAVMRAGKIEQVGPARTLYNAPVNAFVAQFFGSQPMNLFPGRVVGTTWQGYDFSISSIRPALSDGQSVWLGIRPEHVELAEDGIHATVENIETLLADRRQILFLRVAGQECLASVPDSLPIETGQRLSVTFPHDHIYLFDQKTGQRIG